MLVLHSSSRCDVCLSEYSWDSSAKRPHAIACGHIFCRDCLYSNTPPLCPLCRHLYQPNKMKRLHVDKPEDIDDHKEIDLLQRLVISWDTPPDQLKEIVNEVDLWLGHRSDDACVALRKARAALERTKDLKDAASNLTETVHKLESELIGLHDITQEQTTSRATATHYAKQIESMTKYIYALRYQLDHFRALNYTYPYSQNPLPAPPQPISTPNLPSLEQALSESGLGSRVLELPASPSTSYPFEVESRRSRKSKKRTTNTTERGQTFDDTRQQFQSVSSPLASTSTSHYVQPHINAATHHEQSYASQSNNDAYYADSANGGLDVYALTEASLREYSTGFVSGVEAAIGRRRQEPTSQRSSHARPAHSNTRHASSQSFSALESADSYRPPSRNVYQDQPYSAPVPRERSPSRRQSTVASSIVSSAASHTGGGTSSRSRSRSQSAHVPHDQQRATNPSHSLTSILSTDVVNLPSSYTRRSHGGGRAASPRSSRGQAQSAFVDPHLPPASLNASTPSAPNDYPNSPSTTYSRRTRNTVTSWGTNTASHLTSGSLISDLHFFRPGVALEYDIGSGVHEFAQLNSDGESIRRHSNGSINFDEMATTVSRSPARDIHTMTGILPEELENLNSLNLNRHAPESVGARESSRRSSRSGRDANGHTTRSNRSSGHEQHSDGLFQNPDSIITGFSSGYLERREEFLRAGQRPSSPPGPVSYDTISWDTWPSNPNVNGSSLFATNVPADAEYHSSGSGEGTRHRRSGRPARSTLVLPDESPVSAEDIDYSTGYRPYGSTAAVVGHSNPSPGAPASFSGNALGLELEIGPTSINAPIPTVPQSFLRTWSHDH